MDEAAGGNQSPLLFTPTILEQTGRVSRQRMLAISSPSSTIHHTRAIILLLWGVLLGFFLSPNATLSAPAQDLRAEAKQLFLFSPITPSALQRGDSRPLQLVSSSLAAAADKAEIIRLLRRPRARRCARHRKHQIWRQR